MTDYKITPPPELVEQWYDTIDNSSTSWKQELATQAALWGADQELEACCEALARELICDGKHVATDLRSVRRPKPPSLAEQALTRTNAILNDPNRALLIEVRETLELTRRALERLQELEGND